MNRTVSIAIFLVVTFLFGSTAHAKKEAPTPDKQKIVVKLGHFTDDLHPAFMAIKLATMLQESGAEVTLFLNLEAVRLADKRHPVDLKLGTSDEIGSLYGKAMKSGIPVVVCPHCAKAAGIAKKNLEKGAVIGTKKTLVKIFLEADKLLDY